LRGTQLGAARSWWLLALLAGLVLVVLSIPRLVGGGHRRPDIVLILTDDQRFNTLWAMPKTRDLLVRHGVRFTNAFVVNPLCCPSRSSILTGNYSHTTGVYDNVGPHGGFGAFDDSSTLATWLHAAGYRTGLVGKYLNGYENTTYTPPGWDRWFALWQEDYPGYYDYEVTDQHTARHFGGAEPDYSTDVFARRAASFISHTPSSQPLFLELSLFGPHAPATPPARFRSRFANLPPWRPPNYNEADVSDKPRWLQAKPRWGRALRAAADAFVRRQYQCLLADDDAVTRVVRALRQSGRLSDTMIVLMGDNGIEVGEHRLLGKGDPYEASIRVPLVVNYPPLTTGAVDSRHMALNIDLAPTFTDVAAVHAPSMDGASLLPLLGGEDSPWRSGFLIEHLGAGGVRPPTFCAVRTSRFIYVAYASGDRELYALDGDPWELANRAGDVMASTERHFHDRLAQLCRPPPPGMAPLS
jgi:arylsulfatase A-like enzyme